MTRFLAKRPAVLLAALLASGCASNEVLPVYKLYPGPLLAEDVVATVRAGNWVSGVRIDGLAFSAEDYDRVHVLPGPHKIEWTGKFVVSDEGEYLGKFTIESSVTLDLDKGEVYILHAGRPGSEELEDMLWIEAERSGDVVYQRHIFDQ